MKNWKVFALALVGALLIPAAVTLAAASEAPQAEALPAAEAPAEAPPEASQEPPAAIDGDLDLDLGLFELPKLQKKIRQCTAQEAASIGCDEECCVVISNTPRCTFC